MMNTMMRRKSAGLTRFGVTLAVVGVIACLVAWVECILLPLLGEREIRDADLLWVLGTSALPGVAFLILNRR